MIFVDTSVWIAYLRDRQDAVAVDLERLLDADSVAVAAPVRLELLSGTAQASYSTLKKFLGALPVFYPSKDTWSLAERWGTRATTRGHRFGFGDLLIGTIAAERGGQIWSLDSDFRRMERLKLLKCYRRSAVPRSRAH